MREIRGELFVSLVLVLLLGIVFNPWSMVMPDYVVMALLTGLIVSFIGFAVFVWREGSGDERETAHRLLADRVAYLIGSALLLIGVIIQEFRGSLDPWLIFVLAAMVLGKVAGLLYAKSKL